MKLIVNLSAIALTIVGLSACAPQAPGNNNAPPLMNPAKPLSPAAAISAGSGFPHSGMNAPQ